jgi:asparagine synthase (glutamine-hydrolysing)
MSGEQPMVSTDGSIVLSVNGEIYNYKELMAGGLTNTYEFQTGSDCEVLMYLYAEKGAEFLNDLQGDFAFVMTNSTTNSYIVARDPIGVVPLYWGKDASGALWFASEMKALVEDCEEIAIFPPGSYYTPETGFVRYYEPSWWDPSVVPTTAPDLIKIRDAFTKAVERRLMAEVPFGILLSGGLDSSLVASVATRLIRARGDQSPIASFSIGLKGQSPDLVAAQKVADFLGTKHYEFTFTLQDGLDVLRKLVWHLETYDVTTIRASTPMFLLARRIKAIGYKMVLSGEGSDEELAGYLYFHNAPSAAALHEETVNRVKNLHTSDCLRANKSTAAWGLEVRVPFLDKDFIDVAMSFDPAEKLFGEERGRMEKYIIRKAFDDEEHPYLPKDVLWRQKEQFSDGVGYSWIDTLIATAAESISDVDFEKRAERWPEGTPITKEAYFYRNVFDELFPHQQAKETVAAWVPTWGNSKDPSGRAQKFHSSHDETK